MRIPEKLKVFPAPVQGEDRHRYLMKELDRIIRYLFDDETTGKEVKIHEKK